MCFKSTLLEIKLCVYTYNICADTWWVAFLLVTYRLYNTVNWATLQYPFLHLLVFCHTSTVFSFDADYLRMLSHCVDDETRQETKYKLRCSKVEKIIIWIQQVRCPERYTSWNINASYQLRRQQTDLSDIFEVSNEGTSTARNESLIDRPSRQKGQHIIY